MAAIANDADQASINSPDFDDFLALQRPQLASSGIPEHFWNSIFHKTQQIVFDAGESFQILQLDDGKNNRMESHLGRWKVIVTDENGIDPNDPSRIYLIDHAWTYRPNCARQQLQQVPGLLERMCSLMDIDVAEYDEESRDEAIDEVLTEMWKYNNTYSISTPEIDAESAIPVWYIMDEFGARIQCSDDPSCRVVPFYDAFTQTSYSLLFPVKNIPKGGEVTRDYIEGPNAIDDRLRMALKQPWFPSDMTEEEYFCPEPSFEYYSSHRQNETLPKDDLVGEQPPRLPLKVFTQYGPIASSLKDHRFVIVDDEADADILWFTDHFKDFRSFSDSFPNKFVNQFPFESVLTVKDLLNAVCRRIPVDDAQRSLTRGRQQPWLPITFNLLTELPQFVGYFQFRHEQGLDNHWICKPWNLARGLDIHVTDNLAHIVRLHGPKVCCKYVEDPVLFRRSDMNDAAVKFDIRYIVLLQSVRPLRLFVYRRFWIRFANRPFTLRTLDSYETHFTVMNYTADSEIRQIYCEDFIRELERQYPDVKYENIEADIFTIFEELFLEATSVDPPRGIAHSRQSRAVYGVDIMLEWNHETDGCTRVQPVLLEVNYAPDCLRACHYYDDFYDDVFAVLFLNESEGRHVVQLCSAKENGQTKDNGQLVTVA